MILQRVFLILLVLVALFDLVGSLEGSWRKALSTLVTFSNQVTLGVFVWSVWAIDWLGDLLAVYEALLGTVFFLLVVPLNGMGSISLADVVIYAIVPIVFLIAWFWKEKNLKRNSILESRFYVFAYPILYLPFIFLISYSRGYMIYPILNPLYLCIVGGILEGIRICFLKKAL